MGCRTRGLLGRAHLAPPNPARYRLEVAVVDVVPVAGTGRATVQPVLLAASSLDVGLDSVHHPLHVGLENSEATGDGTGLHVRVLFDKPGQPGWPGAQQNTVQQPGAAPHQG